VESTMYRLPALMAAMPNLTFSTVAHMADPHLQLYS